MVARSMIVVAAAPPRAVADHLTGVYTVEVDQPMSEWPLLVICFEERSPPLNPVEPHEPLRWWEIYKAGLIETQISARST